MKKSNITLAIFFVMSMLICAISIVLEDKKNAAQTPPIEAEKTATGTEQVKTEFADYEKELMSVGYKCEQHFKAAIIAVENKEKVRAYEYFDNATLECGSASTKILQVKVPINLQQQQRSSLKKAAKLYSEAYLAKAMTADYLKDVVNNKNVVENTAYADKQSKEFQNKLLAATAKFTTVKVELDIN